MLDNFYYKKDRLNQLRGFCTTVQTNSIIKASRIMNVEPTTISKQIKALERDLNINLFDRETKKQRLILTDKGKEFYKVAVSALQNVESVFRYFADNNIESEKKEIRIAAHHTVFVYLVPQYIKKFNEITEYSEFYLEYSNLSSSLNSLMDDKIDLVLYPVDTKYDEFDMYEIYDLKPTILVNKNNELAKKFDEEITFMDLSKQNVMMIDNDRILPYFNNICSEFNIGSNIKFKNTDWEMIRNFVKLDLGVHLYTELYDKFSIFKDKDIVSKSVSKLFPNVKLNLITKKDKIQSPIVNRFIDMIKNTF